MNSADFAVPANSRFTCYAGLPGAIGSGNLPTLPAPDANRLLADFKSPWVAWPALAAREVKITTGTQAFDVDIRDGAGNHRRKLGVG